MRRLAWLIAAAAIVPLLMFWIIEAGFKAREERRMTEASALSASESVQYRVDGEIQRQLAGLAALATTASLQSGDLRGFRARAADLILLNADWAAATIVDARSGASLMEVGAGKRSFTSVPSSRLGGSAFLAGFARGDGCPCYVLGREAVAGGKPVIVRIEVSNRALLAMLPSPAGEYATSAIVDRSGHFVARTVDGNRKFGLPSSKYLRAAVALPALAGSYRGFTLEGLENFTAYRRSPSTGWSTHFALRAEHVDQQARRFLQSLGVAAFLSLLLAGILVWFALRQIAERRRISARMEQAQKLEALGQLTGGIAHDFNNLLTPVLGALDFVANKPAIDPASKRLLLGALGSAKRASKLTQQLLAFSRKQHLKIQPVVIATMLHEIADLFRQSVGDSHPLEIVMDDATLCALGDVIQLELATLNILLNARDAAPPGSTITVRASAGGEPDTGEVLIAITDRGAGMDEVTLRRAVEPFFTTKALGRGTGLGLAQAFGMAEQSGGRLTIASSPDSGTTVTIALRRCDPPSGQAALDRPTEAQNALPLRLLVIDDDPAARAAIVGPLEHAAHVVDVVSDGATGLAALRERAFDLVLVDYAMPGMDGAEFIRRARKLRTDARFLIVSGYSDSDAINSSAPGTPVLGKPFANDDLLALVRELAS